MFTGIIEALGTVRRIDPGPAGRDLVIAVPPELAGWQMGESVALNGCCLTVVEIGPDWLRFQAGPETLSKTDLGELAEGDRVNLERSLRLSDRLGGHLVQGHVDGVGRIAQRIEQSGPTGDRWELIWFSCSADLAAQMVPKGSIAVDGVSLTLVDVESSRFSVALIPHTLAVTTLGFKPTGAAVNLETDIVGKYVQKFLHAARPPS